MLFERKTLSVVVCMLPASVSNQCHFACQRLPSGAATDFLKLRQELDIPAQAGFSFSGLSGTV